MITELNTMKHNVPNNVEDRRYRTKAHRLFLIMVSIICNYRHCVLNLFCNYSSFSHDHVEEGDALQPQMLSRKFRSDGNSQQAGPKHHAPVVEVTEQVALFAQGKVHWQNIVLVHNKMIHSLARTLKGERQSRLDVGCQRKSYVVDEAIHQVRFGQAVLFDQRRKLRIELHTHYIFTTLEIRFKTSQLTTNNGRYSLKLPGRIRFHKSNKYDRHCLNSGCQRSRQVFPVDTSQKHLLREDMFTEGAFEAY